MYMRIHHDVYKDPTTLIQLNLMALEEALTTCLMLGVHWSFRVGGGPPSTPSPPAYSKMEGTSKPSSPNNRGPHPYPIPLTRSSTWTLTVSTTFILFILPPPLLPVHRIRSSMIPMLSPHLTRTETHNSPFDHSCLLT